MNQQTNTRAEVRSALRESEKSRASIVDSMQALIDRWNTIFFTPAPAHPVIHSVAAGYVYLRWRKKGARGQQSYVNIGTMGEHHGDAVILCSLFDAEFRPSLLAMWRLTSELNMRFSVANSQVLRLKQYLDELDQLDLIENSMSNSGMLPQYTNGSKRKWRSACQ